MSTLDRTTFETSREMEFFTESELRMQIGHAPRRWPVALVKELIDNALDACETVGTGPEIAVRISENTVEVSDNGPGLPADTLRRSLDYMTRVSDKTHYVSPSRGQLGNALKCVWAAPFVATQGDTGRVDVVTGGREYRVMVKGNRIEGRPEIRLEEHAAETFAKNGTTVRLHWPGVAGYLCPQMRRVFYNQQVPISHVAKGVALFNPHLDLSIETPDRERTFAASRPAFGGDKWTPADPTSAHWYDAELFADLVRGYISADVDPTVRAFVGTFDGLSSSKKQRAVLDGMNLSRTRLSNLQDGTDIDTATAAALLEAMQREARRVRPDRLGRIGEDHMRGRLEAAGCLPDSIRYKIRKGQDPVPHVVEVAFGVNEKGPGNRYYGANWTPALENPFGPPVSNRLSKARVGIEDPVTLAVHVAIPRAAYTDRGKTQLELPEAAAERLDDCIRLATKAWTQKKKDAERQARKRRKRRKEAAKKSKPFPSLKAACYHFMEEAYEQASDGGSLPANARQIMYAIRSLVKNAMGNWYSNSQTFTQTVLPQFLDDHPELEREWNVVYDARGRLLEPHTGTEVPLGTVEVRRYLQRWTNGRPAIGSERVGYKAHTRGPSCRYAAALFIEKEGFTPILKDAGIGERYDVAVFSTKGQTVTAARRLAEELARRNVPIFVLHDFDKAGLEILDKLQTDTDRYTYEVRPELKDLGLRLPDVEAMDLESEPVSYQSKKDPRENLAACGATEAEQEFLRSGGRPRKWTGERVELNAMTSRQFVEFVETGLTENGVRKVVPESDVLDEAWERMHALRKIREEVRKARNQDTDAPDPPPDLRSKLRQRLSDTNKSWEDALWSLAAEAS